MTNILLNDLAIIGCYFSKNHFKREYHGINLLSILGNKKAAYMNGGCNKPILLK